MPTYRKIERLFQPDPDHAEAIAHKMTAAQDAQTSGSNLRIA
jgi:hypothetical protein